MINQYTLGVDFGKLHDYSALSLLERIDRFEKRRANEATYGFDDEPRLIRTMYRIMLLERIKIGTPYPDVVKRIRIVMSSDELRDRTTLVVDATGVGQPVVDMIKRERIAGKYMMPIPIVITGGQAISIQRRGYTIPKRDLVEAFQVVLQTGRIKWTKELEAYDEFMREMETFKVKLKKTGHESFEGDVDIHDDLVMATAMAVWYATQGDRDGRMFRPNYKPEERVLGYDPLNRK